jgi:hypothetical protein
MHAARIDSGGYGKKKEDSRDKNADRDFRDQYSAIIPLPLRQDGTGTSAAAIKDYIVVWNNNTHVISVEL